MCSAKYFVNEIHFTVDGTLTADATSRCIILLLNAILPEFSQQFAEVCSNCAQSDSDIVKIAIEGSAKLTQRECNSKGHW